MDEQFVKIKRLCNILFDVAFLELLEVWAACHKENWYLASNFICPQDIVNLKTSNTWQLYVQKYKASLHRAYPSDRETSVMHNSRLEIRLGVQGITEVSGSKGYAL